MLLPICPFRAHQIARRTNSNNAKPGTVTDYFRTDWLLATKGIHFLLLLLFVYIYCNTLFEIFFCEEYIASVILAR